MKLLKPSKLSGEYLNPHSGLQEQGVSQVTLFPKNPSVPTYSLGRDTWGSENPVSLFLNEQRPEVPREISDVAMTSTKGPSPGQCPFYTRAPFTAKIHP